MPAIAEVVLEHVLDPQRVLILASGNKREVLRRLVACLATNPAVEDAAELERGIFHREELMSTGIGLGIGVPHVRLASIKRPVMAVAVCRTPIADYEAIDGEPVRLVVMIAAGEKQHAEHLRLLAAVSKRLKDQELRQRLETATEPEAAWRVLCRD